MPDAFGNIDAEGQDEGTSNVTNFEVNPHGINYTMAAWLYSICKAWDLVPYARERYNEYSNNEKSWAKDVEAGAQATNLPDAACLQVCKRCLSALGDGAEVFVHAGKTPAEIIEAWGWTPGRTMTVAPDDADVLKSLSRSAVGAEKMLAALKEGHELLKPDSTEEVPPMGKNLQDGW